MCKEHGEQPAIKKGMRKDGTIVWRCKECMRTLHQKHYNKNKENVLEKCADYRKKNHSKVLEWKRNYFKTRKDDPELHKKDLDRRREWAKENRDYERTRKKRQHMEGVKNLTDYYVREKLKFNTHLKGEDISPELIELKRYTMKIKRLIKEKKLYVED